MANQHDNHNKAVLPKVMFSPIGPEGHVARCPNCGDGLIKFESQGKPTSIGGGGAFDDGDTIFGLYETLVNGGKEPDDMDFDEANHYYSRDVGSCSACDEGYYAICAIFVDAPKTCHYFVDGYFHRNARIQHDIQNFKANLPGRAKGHWVVSESLTELGIMHEHLFGPFPTNETGRHFDGGRLFDLWDILKGACKEANTPSKMDARPVNEHWNLVDSAGWRIAPSLDGEQLHIFDGSRNHGRAWNSTELAEIDGQFQTFVKYARSGTSLDMAMGKLVEECQQMLAAKIDSNQTSRKLRAAMSDPLTPSGAAFRL